MCYLQWKKKSAFLTIYHYKSTLSSRITKNLKFKNEEVRGRARRVMQCCQWRKSVKCDENSVAAGIYYGKNIVLHSSLGFKPDYEISKLLNQS